MNYSIVRSSKGQIKIQQMAFVILGFVIFFGLVVMLFISFNLSSLRGDAERIKAEGALQTVQSMTGSPELAWTLEDCSVCADRDKAMALKNNSAYSTFWDDSIGLVQIKQIVPAVQDRECTLDNYPDCSTITIFKSDSFYTTQETFIALCRFDGVEKRCDLGKILLGVKNE